MLYRPWRVPLRMLPERLVHRWRMGSQLGGPSNVDGVVGEAPSEIVVGSSFLARLANADPHLPRLPDRLMLGSYVMPQE